MHLYERIEQCKTMNELDEMRELIHLHSTYGEIDFKVAKELFLTKKDELSGKVPASKLNWRN